MAKRLSAQKRADRAYAVSRLYLIDMTLTHAGHERIASFIPGIIEELKELRVATGYYRKASAMEPCVVVEPSYWPKPGAEQ
jgi:hypothetical protein